ncbi:MAG: hypothetical protein AB1585_03430 [Thermodesulfobacteriota bacterium]
MEAILLQSALKKDGEIVVTALPYKKGEQVELILLFNRLPIKSKLTTRSLKKRPALQKKRLGP